MSEKMSKNCPEARLRKVTLFLDDCSGQSFAYLVRIRLLFGDPVLMHARYNKVFRVNKVTFGGGSLLGLLWGRPLVKSTCLYSRTLQCTLLNKFFGISGLPGNGQPFRQL